MVVPAGGFGATQWVVTVSPLFMTHGEFGLSPVPPFDPCWSIVGLVLQVGNFTCGFGGSCAAAMSCADAGSPL